MPELIRPSPAPSWRDRVAAATSAIAAPGRVLAAAGAVLVVAAAAWWLLRAPPAAVEDRLPFAATAATTAPPTSSGGGSGPATTVAVGVVVQAAGAVARPGVYGLPAGARVTDLLAAAGGALPDAQLDSVALAAKLADGQRVYVPRTGEAPPAAIFGGNGSSPGEPTPEAPLDLNTATADQLDLLPSVGPATAAAIVAHRDEHGPFRSVDGLLEVRGIGPGKLDGLRDLVTV